MSELKFFIISDWSLLILTAIYGTKHFTKSKQPDMQMQSLASHVAQDQFGDMQAFVKDLMHHDANAI